VLAVDIEHGEVLWDAGFLKVDDKTLYMNILGVGERDSSSIRQIVVCVTDGGGVWGVDVDVKEAHERNVYFLGSIAAMFLNGQSRITSYIEKARNDVVISENQIKDNVAPLEEEVSYDSVGMEKSNDEPEFVSECGYRGPREGYTFWTNDRGENGYYRNDVMQKILEKDLNASKIRDDASENCSSPIEKKECLDSESGSVCSYRKFIRCFEYLDRLKQFVISSVGSEDGTIYTGRLDMMESSASLLTVEAEVKRDVDAHESGVLVFASTTDQKVVASGSYDQKIKIWDTSQWNCLKILSGHGGGIKNLLFTPDDSTMISTSSDNTIRVR
jgi:WD40 repeat protein